MRVAKGYRPDRRHCTQINIDVWNMLQRCWDKDPSRRPLMAILAQFFTRQATSVGAYL
jgi:hypothetical protein